MKKIFYLVIIAIIASCSNNDDFDLLSKRLALKEVVIENNKVKLEWNRPYINNFSRYLVFKSNNPDIDYSNYYYGAIAEIYDIEETTYFDNLSLEEDVYYTIVAYSYNSESLVSNTQQLTRDNIIIFQNKPDDAIFYPEQDNLFIVISNVLYKLDYKLMEIQDSIILGSSPNYWSLGKYNGNYELYAGCCNGYAKIYDANTLDEKVSFYVGGEIQSVVTDNNGNLFIKSYEGWDGVLKSYKRNGLTLTDTYTGWFDYKGKIKHLNNSNRIIEITTSVSPVNLIYYDHDSEGNFTNVDDDNYHGDYPLDAKIFTTFPDGDYFITDNEGAIYNSNLTYIAQLAYGYASYYNNFFIDDYIYAAYAEEPQIQVFSKTSYNMVNSYNTSYYPAYIFKDSNELISISSENSNYQYYSNSKFTIEKITLE